MIHITAETKIPSVETTLGILRAHNELMPIFIDYDKLHQYISFFLLKASHIKGPLYDVLQYKEGYEIKLPAAIKNYLTHTGNNFGFDMVSTGISLNAESINNAINSGRLSEEAVIVLDAYKKLSYYDKCARTLMTYLQFPVCNLLSYNGHRMSVVRPKWCRQNTGRVGMQDPAIQNLNRVMQDIITVPKGWILTHCDSGQIDPRVIYSTYINDPQIQACINLYDDAYFGLLHYCTMPDSLIKSGTTSFQKNVITPEMQENRKSIKTFCNAVVYGSTSNPSADPIKAALIKRIGNHPLRDKWVQSIEKELDMGNYIVKTAFGTPIDIMQSAKIENDNSRYQLIKLAINNPIQGTSADLMRLSCSYVNDLFSRKATNSAIIAYIHDAAVTAVHESDYDKVIDDVKACVAYDVPNWIPIKADVEIGRSKGLFEDLY